MSALIPPSVGTMQAAWLWVILKESCGAIALSSAHKGVALRVHCLPVA